MADQDTPDNLAERIYSALSKAVDADQMTQTFRLFTLPVLAEVVDLMRVKSMAYRDAAFTASGLLSPLPPEDAILVRADDKLRRIMSGDRHALGEDSLMDLIGYLVLYMAVTRSRDTQ